MNNFNLFQFNNSKIYFFPDLISNTLPLRIDEAYSIVNTATKHPLLHTSPQGPELLYLSHWWQFVPVSNNTYYLQTQDETFNSTAPRWGRFIRLEKSDKDPDTYHLLPVTCFNFDKNRLINPPNSYIYVDYFDKFGRDLSECVNKTRVEAATWHTNLTEERVYTKPAGFLDESNFLYKISPVGDRIKERLTEGVDRVEFSAGQVHDHVANDTLLLVDLEIKEAARKYDESPADDDDGVELSFFNCHAGHDFTFERTIWSLVIPSGDEFTLMMNPKVDLPKFLSIDATVEDGIIGRNSKLVDPDWKIVSNVASNLTWMTISGLGPFGNFGEHNTSSNYFSYQEDGDLVKFHYSDTNPNFVVTFHSVKPTSGEDGIICSRSFDEIFYSNDVLIGHNFEKQSVFVMLTVGLVLGYLIRCCIRNWKLSGESPGTGYREGNMRSSTAILINSEEMEYYKPEINAEYSKA